MKPPFCLPGVPPPQKPTELENDPVASVGQNTAPVDGNTNNAGSGTGHNHSHTLSGTLTGNITTSLTGNVTAAGNNAFSPFVVVNYIIKH